MSNTTRTIGPAYYSYIAYIIEGLGIGAANLLVACSILYHRALRRRKEYIILMALSVADAVNMIALFFAVDRLLSVAAPLMYISLTRKYAERMVLGAFGFTISMGVTGYLLAYNAPQKAIHSVMCGPGIWKSGGGLSELWSVYYREKATEIFSTGSILVFILVAPVYSYQKNKVGGNSVDEKRKLEQQLKVTKSMAISCLCTLLVYTIPVKAGYDVYNAGMPGLGYALWAFSSCNALCNVFIYQLRHSEMRQALSSMLICKVMPPSLHLWQVTTTNQQSAPRVVQPISNQQG